MNQALVAGKVGDLSSVLPAYAVWYLLRDIDRRHCCRESDLHRNENV